MYVNVRVRNLFVSVERDELLQFWIRAEILLLACILLAGAAVGCCTDTVVDRPRPLPILLHNMRGHLDWKNFNHSRIVEECKRHAAVNDFKVSKEESCSHALGITWSDQYGLWQRRTRNMRSNYCINNKQETQALIKTMKNVSLR